MARIYDFTTGDLLESVQFSEKECNGATWLNVPISGGVPLLPEKDYMAVIDDVLFYAKTDNYFQSHEQRGKLTFIQGYHGEDSGVMPREESHLAANYWIDGERVHFSPNSDDVGKPD